MSGATALLALSGALVLRAFFVALRTRWPLAYFGFGSAIDPIVRRSMVRYVMFRAGPVFLCATFVGVTAERWGDSALIAIVLMLLAHLATTYGLGIYRAVRARRLETRIASFWIASAALAATAALVAVPLTRLLEPLVPPPAEMVAALWTGIFASAIAVAALRSLGGDPVDLQSLVERSAAELPVDLEAYVRSKCDEFEADFLLVKAVMLIENLQRPGWVRKLERLKGRLHKPGSYGVMQVTTDKPVSDRESIDIAVSGFFAGSKAPAEESWWERDQRLRPIVVNYNSNPIFVDMVMQSLPTGAVL